MKSDLSMLTKLLSLPPEELGSNRKPFQSMYDNLANGKQVKLSKKQRVWVEQSYQLLKLDKRVIINPTPVQTRDKNVPKPLHFGTLPKKPPGRA